MLTKFVVVFETGYVTKILFEGTMPECKKFIKMNPELCSDYAFVQEVELV